MRGGTLTNARIGYETWGAPNAARDNILLILPGLSPNAHAACHEDDQTPGWWERMLGSGKPIDTDCWYVICINSLGSCKGSTGPASRDPKSGVPYRMNFPDLCIEDIADSAAFAVRALGFERLACVIGTSMGGMSALSLAARHPDLAYSQINISSATHSLPFGIAIRSFQREVIRLDPKWRVGQYTEKNYPQHGMRMARKLGMVSYRSAEEWDGRFDRKYLIADCYNDESSFGLEFEVESYLESHANRFARTYDPNCYLYLSRCMDWFNLGASSDVAADAVLAGCSFPVH